MTIEMQTCYTDQTSTVQKFLENGFEPFAAFPVKVGRKDGEDKVRIKMYFKKMPPLEIPTIELQQVEAPDFVSLFSDFIAAVGMQTHLAGDRIVDVLGELITEVKELKSALTVGHAVITLPQGLENIENRLEWDSDNDRLVERPSLQKEPEPVPVEDLEGPGSIAAEVKELEDEALKSGDTPGGDGFRFVDDVPALPTSSRTPAQESMVKTLRDRYGSISVFGTTNGDVKVLAANYIYYIKPDGTTVEEETNANTSSLAV